MFSKLFRILNFFSFFVLLQSCTKDNAFDCFKTTGPDKTEERALNEFENVIIYDNMELNLVQGSTYKITITAGKNLIESISTNVENSTLVIENNNMCNFVRGYKRKIILTLEVPKIKKITNAGVAPVIFHESFALDTIIATIQNSGDVYLKGNYYEIRTSTHGNGDMNLSGKCNRLFVYTNGTNYVRAENLEVSEYAFIETYSIGHCYLNTTQLTQFDYNIHLSGNIYYKGMPALINNFSKSNVKGKAIPY